MTIIVRCTGKRRMLGYIGRVMRIVQKSYEMKLLRESTKVLNATMYPIKDDVKLVLQSDVFQFRETYRCRCIEADIKIDIQF